MSRDSRIALLRGVWLFEQCSRAELALLAKTATAVHVEADKVLAREGEIGREFFVIVSGRVEATRSGVRLAKLFAGDFFGEMSLVDRQRRTATVTTSEPTELMVLTRQQFLSVIDAMPSVDRKIIAVLAHRLRELEDRFLPEEVHIDAAAVGASVENGAQRENPRSPAHTAH
jgi:CRP-like cAMP-binding protein